MKSLLLMNLIAWLIIAMVIGVSGALYVLRPTVSTLPSNITAHTTSTLFNSINPTAILLAYHPDSIQDSSSFFQTTLLLLARFQSTSI
jgi:hypothetical protein